MRGISFVPLFQVLKYLCLLLLCVFAIAVNPQQASASSFQDQAVPLIEEIQLLQSSGENMESLRSDRSKLAACGIAMRRLQPQAEALSEQIDALEIDESQPDSFQASMAKGYLSSAAGSLSLCNSCLSWALDSCQQVSSSLEVAAQIMQGE